MPNRIESLNWQNQHASHVMFLEANEEDLSHSVHDEWIVNRMLPIDMTHEITANLLDPEPSAPAEAWDAPQIPNGTYTVETVNGQEFEYLVYLVSGGQLAGKRIAKYKHSDGVYRGFAFITRAGNLNLWRRFHEDIDEPYVQIGAHAIRTAGLMNMPHEQGAMSTISMQNRGNVPLTFHWTETNAFGLSEDVPATLRIRHACWRCNGPVRLADDSRIARCTDHPMILPAHVEEAPFFQVIGTATVDAEAGEIVSVRLDEGRQELPARAARRPARGRTARVLPLSETGDGSVQ